MKPESGVAESLNELVVAGKRIATRTSESCSDTAWDRFLEETESGEHEQSSMWAEVKSLDGWRPFRCVLHCDNQIVAGFQLLHRSVAGVGRLGYITRGPAFARTDPDLFAHLPRLIQLAASRRHVHAMIIHPPRTGQELLKHFPTSVFLPNHLVGLIDGTLELNLLSTEEALLGQMRTDRRRNIRKAIQAGILFREGKRDDLPGFFDLMKATCARQNTKPNPNRIELLQELWAKYQPKGHLRLFIANINGVDHCGGIVIPYRDRAILWKIGWSGEHKQLHPNDFLHWRVIQWARTSGYRLFDFAGIDIDLAEAIRGSTGPVEPAAMRTPSFYKLGFGGRLVRFPAGLVYFKNSIPRMLYRLWSRSKSPTG